MKNPHLDIFNQMNNPLAGNPFDKDQVPVEKDVPFSKSILWKAQRDFFAENGVNAWDHQVPFYITSNPYIAKSYAIVVIRYIQDLHRNKKINPEEPIYIFELGTGSGKFSFYMMKHLFEMQKTLRLQTLNIRYVMTDFTAENMKFWEKHHLFQDYIDNQQLDFAVYDIENDKDIFLHKAQKRLSKEEIINPTVVIANYVFDTVKHDIFHFENERIYATHINTFTNKDNFKVKKFVKLDNIDVTYTNHELKQLAYYQDPKIDSVLVEYKKLLKDSTILFPIGSLRFLQTFRRLLCSDLMVISTDKSYALLPELENLSPPSIAFHGSFSMMVNFHAIGAYFEGLGGHAIHQSMRDGIKTSVFILGSQIEELPETQLAVDERIKKFSPGDFFNLYHFLKTDQITPKAIAAELQMVDWDPYIFSAQVRKILPHVDEMGHALRQYFVDHVQKLASNFYIMPGESDAFFDLGVFLQSVKLYKESAMYFELSVKHYGDNFATYYNLGLCHYYLREMDKATEYLRRADTLESNGTQAKDLMEEIRKIKEKEASGESSST